MPLRMTAEPDPIASYEYGPDSYIYQDVEYRALVCFSESGATRQCTNEHRRSGYQCTRPEHPAWWKHVYSNREYLHRVWDGEPAPTVEGWLDPEDGSAVDPAEIIDANSIKIGYCYKLRDRENQLYVIGGVGEYFRADKLIEVLDLKKREFRTLPVDEIVASEYVMTPDELSWVVTYVAQVRQIVKTEAVTMYRKDKWCRDGLNAALKDLGMAPYVPELSGELVIRLPWTAPEGAVRSTVRTALEKAFKAADFSTVNDTLTGDIEIEPQSLTLSLENVGRR